MDIVNITKLNLDYHRDDYVSTTDGETSSDEGDDPPPLEARQSGSVTSSEASSTIPDDESIASTVMTDSDLSDIAEFHTLQRAG